MRVTLSAATVILISTLSLTYYTCSNTAPITTSTLGIEQRQIGNIHDYVTPSDPLVRNAAISAVSDAPDGIYSNSHAWKIWQINYWAANNINYVDDPKGQEYYAYPRETLEVKGGDCDDIAFLLASMYEAVGVDAAIAYINTGGKDLYDHMAGLVYYPETAELFINEALYIMKTAGVNSPTALVMIRYMEAERLNLASYSKGIWIIADPQMQKVNEMVGYITYEPYDIISVINVGN